MSIAPLETERLRIRDFEAEDLETYHRLYAEAFDSTRPLEGTRDWLDWTVRNYAELAKLYQPPYGDYAITLKDKGLVIGVVGLVPALIPWNTLLDEQPPDYWATSPEFGLFWAVFEAYQGQGYATEAGRAVIEHVFDSMHARQIVATTEHENAASQRVMTQAGDAPAAQ